MITLIADVLHNGQSLRDRTAEVVREVESADAQVVVVLGPEQWQVPMKWSEFFHSVERFIIITLTARGKQSNYPGLTPDKMVWTPDKDTTKLKESWLEWRSHFCRLCGIEP